MRKLGEAMQRELINFNASDVSILSGIREDFLRSWDDYQKDRMLAEYYGLNLNLEEERKARRLRKHE